MTLCIMIGISVLKSSPIAMGDYNFDLQVNAQPA